MSRRHQQDTSIVLATASYDHTIRFWEIHSGKNIMTIKTPDTQINSMALNPVGDNLAAAGNPNIMTYDYLADTSPVANYTGHASNVTQIGFEKDGKWLYSGSEDKTVKIWDIRAAGCQKEMENTCSINTVTLHPNQVEILYGDQEGSLKVWDLRTNSCSRALVPAGKVEIPMRSITVAPNGKRVVAANNKGQCYVWRMGKEDTRDIEPYTKLDAHHSYVMSVRISPDCKYVATASADHTVKVFDMKHFRTVQTFKGHEDWVWDIQWSIDSAFIVTCSSDSTAKLWSVASGEIMREYEGHSKTISAIVLGDTPPDE